MSEKNNAVVGIGMQLITAAKRQPKIAERDKF